MTMVTMPGLGAGTKPQAVILAGGRSSRFGEDKAGARYKKTTMLEEIATSLQKAGFQIAISTSHKEHREFGYPLIWDREPFLGPLHALRAILEDLPGKRVFLSSCDIPFLSPRLAQWLWGISQDLDIVLLGDKSGQPSPLPGVYSRQLLPMIREKILKKEASLKSLLAEGDIKKEILSFDSWRKWDVKGRSLVNINTPQDLRREIGGEPPVLIFPV